uniref:Glycosyltransferase n=1 Tax=Erythranthe lewisii TaxID=69919 RepID=W8EG09_ERYLE|nr:flavonoid 3-O-glucosyltransferase [Erythranthe lewisii]
MSFHLHIGVLAFPFGTHAAPLLALVQRLATASAPAGEAGARFSFFNSAVSNSSMSFSNSCENIKAYDVWDGTPEGEVFGGTHSDAVGLFLKASPRNFEKAIEEAEEDAGMKISCLISDAFLWFACDLAERRGVPWVPFWTAASCSLSAHFYTEEILTAFVGFKETAEQEQTLTFIPGLSKVHFSDLPPEIFVEQNPSPLAITINNMVGKLPKATAVVLNSFEEIDPIITKDLKSKFQDFLNVGPSILASPDTPPSPDHDKTGCLSWLETQNKPKSVVYISFGTVVIPSEKELLALAETLETRKLPFLWSLGGNAKKYLPEGFIERTSGFGKIVPWAPQAGVLAHNSVGVFVTHCGWNSVLESVSRGVPLICRPFFGDQKINSRMVEVSWKIGVRVEGGVFTKASTMKALDRIMSGEAGKVIRENVRRLKDKAVSAVELKGSSSKNFEKLLEIISVPN